LKKMSGHNSEIAPCMAGWIERNMPEIGGMRGVRVRCCDILPFQWLPGFMPTVVGITLWNTIYLKKRCCPIDPHNLELVGLLLHELVHVGQFRRGPLLFPLRYLIDLARFGYWNIPAESEAREREKELLDQYIKELPCFS
jgi:hypothetical protein